MSEIYLLVYASSFTSETQVVAVFTNEGAAKKEFMRKLDEIYEEAKIDSDFAEALFEQYGVDTLEEFYKQGAKDLDFTHDISDGSFIRIYLDTVAVNKILEFDAIELILESNWTELKKSTIEDLINVQSKLQAKELAEKI